jgi:Lrp/AsnC family transcriptional regulator
MKQLDDIDRRILKELQRDASLTMDALADAAHLSRNACWRRMRNLEDSGIILGRTILVDPNAVGCPLQVMVLIKTSSHDAEWLKTFDAAVRNLPQIVGAFRMTGDLDYVLRVRVADMDGYDRFYKELIDRVAVSDISASFVMETIKDTTHVPL